MKNITAHRAGADGALDTADDDRFDDLRELDAVSYVGSKVFESLLAYARAHGYVEDDPAGTGFCKMERAGTTPSGAAVTLCDATFDSAPFVHVPADTTSGGSLTTYGGIQARVGLALDTADRRQLALVDASGDRYGMSNGPAGFQAPENLFAIYRVTGTPTMKDGSAALTISKVEPVAWIPGAVQDKLLLGTWEATAAARVGDHQFDENQPVPFRFTLSTTTDKSSMWTALGGGEDSSSRARSTISLTARRARAERACRRSRRSAPNRHSISRPRTASPCGAIRTCTDSTIR